MKRRRAKEKKKNDKMYFYGAILMLLGGASLADHISYGVDAFPISAVVFGLGIALCIRSYL